MAAVIDQGAAAWTPFLREYTGFILGCIRRLSSDHDQRMDMYLHVCARLYEDDCRRLRTFRGATREQPCKFTTWLATVTVNLSREWVRQTHGRKRLFRAVERLPAWHRRAFEYHYWEGYGVAETTQLLRSRHAAVVSETDVATALGAIRTRIGQASLWRLIARRHGEARLPRVDDGAEADRLEVVQVAAPELPPESVAATVGAVATLREALATLPEVERRALELRFRSGLPAREIAGALGCRTYKQVYEIQARALAQLRAVLIARGWSAADFVHMHRIGG